MFTQDSYLKKLRISDGDVLKVTQINCGILDLFYRLFVVFTYK